MLQDLLYWLTLKIYNTTKLTFCTYFKSFMKTNTFNMIWEYSN